MKLTQGLKVEHDLRVQATIQGIWKAIETHAGTEAASVEAMLCCLTGTLVALNIPTNKATERFHAAMVKAYAAVVPCGDPETKH